MLNRVESVSPISPQITQFSSFFFQNFQAYFSVHENRQRAFSFASIRLHIRLHSLAFAYIRLHIRLHTFRLHFATRRHHTKLLSFMLWSKFFFKIVFACALQLIGLFRTALSPPKLTTGHRIHFDLVQLPRWSGSFIALDLQKFSKSSTAPQTVRSPEDAHWQLEWTEVWVTVSRTFWVVRLGCELWNAGRLGQFTRWFVLAKFDLFVKTVGDELEFGKNFELISTHYLSRAFVVRTLLRCFVWLFRISIFRFEVGG